MLHPTWTRLTTSTQLVSGWIQTVYYGITIRAGDPKPQPGSPRYLKHRRIIQSTVILAYLLYTIYEADYWIRQNADFYQILGLPLDADEKRIKSRFRRLYVPQPRFSPFPIKTSLAPPKRLTSPTARPSTTPTNSSTPPTPPSSPPLNPTSSSSKTHKTP